MSSSTPDKPQRNLMMDSRKAKAYLVAEFGWKIILLAILAIIAFQISNGQTPYMGLIWLSMTVVIVAGFMEAGYIGGQTWIDRYTKGVVDVATLVTQKDTEESEEEE